ncbi:MAG: MFS transporter [Candidatus Uhrbacteria bacterium]
MKTEQEKLESNIWKFYLYEILYSLMFYTPIIVLFYQDNGLSLTQIMIIQSINSLVWILMEIPSGYFADVVGRKKSLMLTGIFATLSMLIFGLGSNFSLFLIASLFWALAGVFISGADSAFIYDTLKSLNKETLYKKVWGNTVFCYSLGVSAASIIGGLLGGLNFRYPFFAMLPFYLFLIPLALSFYEPKHYKTITTKNHLRVLLASIKLSLLQNKRIRQLIIYSAVIVSFIDIAYFLYQPYFKLSGLDVVYFGLVFAAFNLIQALSAKYSHLIEKKLGEKISLILLFVLTSLCYLFMGNVIFILSFIFAFLFQFVSGFSSVVISDYIHQETASNIRATILSTKSFVSHIFYALIAPIIGWLVDVYTLSQALTIIGIIVAVAGFIFIWPLTKKYEPKVS